MVESRLEATIVASLLAASLLVCCQSRPPADEPVQLQPEAGAASEAPAAAVPSAAVPAAAVPSAAEASVTTAAPATAYDKALAKYSAQVAFYERKIASGDSGPHSLEKLASALMARAGLTGSLDDYAAADKALASAFGDDVSPASTHLARARLNISLHRLARVPPDLAAAGAGAVVRASTRTAISGMRGDLAMQLGRYEEALTEYRAALAGDANPTNRFRVAAHELATGGQEAADEQLGAIIRTLPRTGQVPAFYHLQRGLIDLEAGAYADALEHYDAADQAFGGWWLVQEHRAEILSLTGRQQEALSIYEAVVAQTADPELMDALADTLEALARPEEAARHRAAAAERFAAMLGRFPEAAYGHALEHRLAHGTAAQALELAKANHALRPNGEATVLLARALLKSGKPAEAARLLETLLQETPYRSADLHTAAHEAYTGLGNTEAAASHRTRALALNPRALD